MLRRYNINILYGTNNIGKYIKLKNILANTKINLIFPPDIGLNINPLETGTTVIENAFIKALAFSKETQLPVISLDSGLYLDCLPANLQPGLFVRRVNGKSLSDNDLFTYYQNLLKKYGGKSFGFWLDGLTLVENCNLIDSLEYKDPCLFTSVPSNKQIPGQPLASLQLDLNLKKYKSEITSYERASGISNFDNILKQFMQKNIKNLKGHE